MKWIFDNKIKFGFFIFFLLINIVALNSIYYNIKNYNNPENGVLVKITEGTMDSGTSRSYYIQDNFKKVYNISYLDRGNGLPLQIGDSVTFINVGSNNCLLIKINGEKVTGFLPKMHIWSLIIIILTSLSFIFLPKLIKRLKNKQDQNITKYLNEKYKNNNNDDGHRIDL